jgi:hypothetical protein
MGGVAHGGALPVPNAAALAAFCAEAKPEKPIVFLADTRAPVNAVLKRVKVPSAELAVCGSDESVTAPP